MRNVLLWSLVILVASAITTAVVADYVQRHPDTLLAQCIARVTCGDATAPQSVCQPASVCQIQPFIDVTPETAIQAMKDLDIITSMVDEPPPPPRPTLPDAPPLRIAPVVEDEFTPPVMAPVDDLLHGIVMTTPVEVPTTSATVPPPCPSPCQGEGSCAAKTDCKQCTSCDQATCCASTQVALLKRAVQALVQAGKHDEARAVAAQVTRLEPTKVSGVVRWQIATSPVDCGQPCEPLKTLPRVAHWQAPADRVVEFVVVQPRVVCPMPAPVVHGFVQHLPPGLFCNDAAPPCATAGACVAMPCAPQLQQLTLDPNAIAGLLGCQNSPTFLERTHPPGVIFCANEAAAPKMKVETYDVGNLVDESLGACQDRLMELIVRMVAPTTWDVRGGYASMDVYPLGNVLVVRQTAEVHEELSTFIGKFQTAVTAATKKATPALTSAEPCCANKLVRVVYPVADLMTSFQPSGPQEPSPEDKLIAALCQAVEPGSWDTAGGPGHVDYYPMGKSLVISHNSQCHERVALFLDRLRAPSKNNVKFTGFDFTSEEPGSQPDAPPTPGITPKTPEQLPEATKK